MGGRRLEVVELAELSHVGRVRAENQDRDLVAPPLIAVADGMGGHQGGEVAADMAVAAMRSIGGEPSPEALREALERANRDIREAAADDPSRAGMGTTATAGIVGEGRLHLAHVGDSRAYLVRDGQMAQLTADHSIVAELVRSGSLTPEEASRHPSRNVITRALGAEREVKVDTTEQELEPGDVVLLCTDGLTGYVPDSEILRIVSTSPALREAAAELVAQANTAGGGDNVTVVLARVDAVTEEATTLPDPGDG
ncbi:MAG: Stp1/IreP family PP2C-type Ser/Thr phosphatase [Thermoleophilia bacterium]|jgi:protein phosphatase|nr:Stp1/IreP family PP2C-type Ser/Thr phosphatase [Thermoleophilia bacterium]